MSELSDRELDVLVAEKVMGWREVWFDRRYHANENKWEQGPVESKAACRHTPIAYWEDVDRCALKEVEEWSPSTDISAAMEILDKAGGTWELIRRIIPMDGGQNPIYYCYLLIDGNEGRATAKTKERAICEAALAALSTVVDEKK